MRVPAAVVLVTNGLYATGGRALFGTITNRVAVDKPIMVRSVNGPQFTIIQGYQAPGITNREGAIRCVYLADGAASLSGFTLTRGSTRGAGADYPDQSGGGVFCVGPRVMISNCVMTGNWGVYGGGAASGTLNKCTLLGNSAQSGGGACDATLINCMISGNSAERGGGGCNASVLNNCVVIGNSAKYGGGTYSALLGNCTLVGNSADSGGGAFVGDLNNCIVYYNTATDGANFYQSQFFGGVLNFCCTTPAPPIGIGNITNPPLFFDYPGIPLSVFLPVCWSKDVS